jgi:hypothetical protein
MSASMAHTSHGAKRFEDILAKLWPKCLTEYAHHSQPTGDDIDLFSALLLVTLCDACSGAYFGSRKVAKNHLTKDAESKLRDVGMWFSSAVCWLPWNEYNLVVKSEATAAIKKEIRDSVTHAERLMVPIVASSHSLCEDAKATWRTDEGMKNLHTPWWRKYLELTR